MASGCPVVSGAGPHRARAGSVMHSRQLLVSKVQEAEQVTSPEPNPRPTQTGPTPSLPSQGSVNEERGQRSAALVFMQVSRTPFPQMGPSAGQSGTPENVWQGKGSEEEPPPIPWGEAEPPLPPRLQTGAPAAPA